MSRDPGKRQGMLVLSRRVGERIRIDNDVIVTVVAVTGGVVRLGFEAPSDVKVLREEVVDYRREGGPETPTLLSR